MTTNYLNHKCESCDSTGAVQWIHGQMLCPACTARYTLSFGATDHLRTMMLRVVEEHIFTYAAFPYILHTAAEEASEIARDEMQRAVEALQAAQLGAKRVTS